MGKAFCGFPKQDIFMSN